MLHELPTKPDEDAMADMVQALFRHAIRGKVELAWTSPSHPHPLSGAQMFDVGDLDELVDAAAKINARPNRNAYIAAGLRREEVIHDRRGRAEDITHLTAVWADCDKPGCLEAALQICETMSLPPSYAIYTGKHPHPRGSLWWILEEPTEEIGRASDIIRALAAKFGSDPKVYNPDRVMRLGGSVAWPLKAGRIVEMTGRIDCETRVVPYTLDEIESQLRRAGVMAFAEQSGIVLDFNHAKPALDLEGLIGMARRDGEWHQSALKAVAHLVGRGLDPDLVEDTLTVALTLPGYTHADTRRDLQAMIAGAVTKWAPKPALPKGGFPLIELGDFEISQAEWLIDNLLPVAGLASIYGPSESFKSFIALDMALSVAHGIPWREREVRPGNVLYVAGEGQRGVMQRSIVWRANRGDVAERCKFWLAPKAVSFLDATGFAAMTAAAKELHPALIVIDTVARTFAGGDENSTKDMNAYVAQADKLRDETEALILFIHHTGKDEERGARGSSAFRAALDAELATERDGEAPTVRLKIMKQKDADKAKPVALRLVSAEGADPKTGEIIRSIMPVLDDDPHVNPAQGGVHRLGRVERQILAALDDGEASHGTLAKRLGLNKGTLNRALKSLLDKAAIALVGGIYMRVDAFREDVDNE